MLFPTVRHSVLLGFAALLLGGADCVNFAIPDDARLTCTPGVEGECPAAFICSDTLARCVPENPEDGVPPVFVGAPQIDRAVVAVGDDVVWTFTVDETLGVPPVVKLGDDAVLAKLDEQDGLSFGFVHTVTADDPDTITARVRLIDVFGNEATVALPSVDVDRVPPVFPTVFSFGFPDPRAGKTHATAGDAFLLTGELSEAGLSVVSLDLLVGDVVIPTVGGVDEFGSQLLVLMTATVPADVDDDDDVRFRLTLADGVGNEVTGETDPELILVDTTPALASITIDGPLANDAITDDADVTVVLASPDAVRVCVRGDLDDAGACDNDAEFVVAASGIAVTLSAGPGRKAIEAVVRDRAFLETVASAEIVLLDDDVVVSAPLITPPAGQTAVKPGDAFTVGGNTVPGATISSVVLLDDNDGIVPGSPVIGVQADGSFFGTNVLGDLGSASSLRLRVITDFAGILSEAGPSTSPAVVVDTAAPAVVVALPATTTSTSVVVDITSADAVLVCVSGDIDPAPDCSLTSSFSAVGADPTVTLLPGAGLRTVSVAALDRAFNRGEAQDTIVLLLDDEVRSAPVLTLPGALDGQLKTKPGDVVAVGGTADPGAAVSSVRLVNVVTGNTVVTDDPIVVVADAAGNLVGNVTIPVVANGTNLTLEVIVDFAGILSVAANSRSAVVVVDSVVPDLTLAPANGSSQASTTLDIVITAPDAIAFSLTSDDVDAVDGGALGVFLPLPANNTQRVFVTDFDGEKTVTVTVRDEAFNTTSRDVTINVSDAVPSVNPVIENNALRAVAGVRTTSTDRLAVSGNVTSSSTIESATIVFVGVGTCTVDVTNLLSVAQTPDGSVLVGDLVVPAIPPGCANATDLRLDVEVASPAAVLSGVQLSNVLYVDDTRPVVTPVLQLAPDADDRFTPDQDVVVVVTVVDAHTTELKVSGNVAAAPPPVDTFAPFSTGPVSLTLSLSNQANDLSFTVRDEVGNEANADLDNIEHDDVPPNVPVASSLIYLEDDNDQTDEALSEFSLAGVGNAIEANGRLFVLAALDDALSSPSSLAPDVRAAANGSFAAIDITTVERLSPRNLQLVVLDRAGNRSSGLLIARPLFTIAALPLPVGDAPFSTALTIAGNSTPVTATIGTVAAVSIIGGTLSFDVADGALPDGVDSVTIAVSGRDPALNAASKSIDRLAATVDFTEPDVDALLIDVIENAPGTADQIAGAAGAVVDFAGPDDLTGWFPAPTLSVLTVAGTRTIALDGGFSPPLPIGNNTLQDVTVRVVDVAGNVTDALLPERNDITRPVITGFTLSLTQARLGIPFDIDFSVVDDEGRLAAVPAPTFGPAATATSNIGSASLDVLTPQAYRAQGIASGLEAANTVTVVAVDDAGNVSLPSTASILFDFTPPTVVFVNPIPRGDGRERTDNRTLQVLLNDGAGSGVSGADADVLDGAAVQATGALTLAGGIFARTFDAVALPEGALRTFAVRPVDNVGNVGGAAIDLRIDSEAPVIDLVITQNGSTDTEPSFSITASNAGEDVDRFECFVGDTGSFSPCALIGNDFTQTSGTAGDGSVHLYFGQRRLTVHAVDVAGNVSAAQSQVITVDRRLALAGAAAAFCALVPDGQPGGSPLSCWGDNRSAMFDLTAAAEDPLLDAPHRIVPSPVTLQGFAGVERFTSNALTDGTMCGGRPQDPGLDDDIRCWGSNANGRAGVVGPARVEFQSSLVNGAGSGRVSKLALSPQRGCVLRASGDLFCWGRNSLNQQVTPQLVATSVRTFELGDAFLCFANNGGQVLCEGDNERGQSGQPPPSFTGTPQPVNGPLVDVVEVALGASHSCGLQGTDGRIACWGDNEFLQAQGPPQTDTRPQSQRFSATPQATSSLQLAVHIAASENRTCYVGVDGVFGCHGSGPFGELGDGSFTARGRASVVRPLAFDVDDVVAAGNTTCVVPSGLPLEVRCFGDNALGQVGNGTASPLFSSVSVALPNPNGVVSGRTLCFDVAGELSCSGDGNGTGVFDGLDFGGTVELEGALATALPVLTTVAQTSGVAVDVASGVACAIISGQAFCRGPSNGPLGTPPQGFQNGDIVTLPFAPPQNLNTPRVLSASGAGGFCATTNQDARCWGDVDPPNSDTPTLVPNVANNPREIVMGRAHACVRTDGGGLGDLICFGENGSNQLGPRPDTSRAAAPVVDGAQPFQIDGGGFGRKLAASGDTTCAIRIGGAPTNVFCWGDNSDGIAGQDPPGVDVDAPISIDLQGGGGSIFQTVALGEGFGCAADFSRLVCWGQVPPGLPFKGAGPPALELLPREVELFPGNPTPPPFTLTGLMAGDGFLCVVNDVAGDPRLQCFGDGTGGVFADGTAMIAAATAVELP
jgi:alpha-tubulin suppressor-like RCC1 family protein